MYIIYQNNSGQAAAQSGACVNALLTGTITCSTNPINGITTTPALAGRGKLCKLGHENFLLELVQNVCTSSQEHLFLCISPVHDLNIVRKTFHSHI